jgi:hypothetical protein
VAGIEREGRVVAGYYRSLTGSERGAAPESDDEQFIRRHLGPACLLVLRLKMISPLSCRVEAGWREEEGWRKFGAAEREAPARASAAQELAAAAPRWRLSWLPLLLAFVTMGAGAVFAYRWGRAMGEAPVREVVGLSATWEGPAVAVEWRREGTALERAERAELLVKEGRLERSLGLTKPELARGGTKVEVSGRDVELTMRLYYEGREVTESIRTVRLGGIEEARPREESLKPAVLRPAGSPLVKIEVRAPEGIQARIVAPVEVVVAVETDEAGRVVKARLVGEGDAVFRYLGGLAVEAVKGWRYRALQDAAGGPVRGYARAEFRFEPNPR